MSDEIELKLELTSDDADKIEKSPPLKDAAQAVLLQAAYFDTAAHDLHKAGMLLRIRQSGDKRVQTVKVAGAHAAGLFARSEWEVPVADNVPVLDDSTPIRALLGENTDHVAPVFEVNVERKTWLIHDEDAIIEVALDRGKVEASGRNTPICEIELELKQGSPALLFALAHRIDAIAPVRIGVLSKADRGYHLLGPAKTAFKQAPTALGRDMDAAQTFQAIAQSCIQQFRLNENILREQRIPDALHQIRVSLRRLRSAFSIFRNVVRDDATDRLRDDLRWLAGEMGDARNLDVLLTQAEPGPLRDRLLAAREDAYERAENSLSSQRCRSLMLDLVEWLIAGEWLTLPATQELRSQPAAEFSAAALDRLRRRVRKDGRNLAELHDDARHEVRKDAKKLRYAAEFFGGLFDDSHQKRRRKTFLKVLEDFQDKLGLLNDMATAPEVFAQLGIANMPETEALLTKDRKKRLLNDAAEAYDDLMDARRFWR